VLRVITTRTLAAVVLLLLVSVLAFGLGELGPDPAVTAAGPGAFPEDIEAARERLDIAGSAPERLAEWSGKAIRGNLGQSLMTSQPITEMVRQRMVVTLTIAVAGITLATVLGFTAGITSAVRAGSRIDTAIRFLVSLALATPPFWFASVLVLLFAVRFRWFPATGWTPFTTSPWKWLQGLVLPAFAVSLFGFAAITRSARNAALGVLSQDYIRSAKMKGLSVRQILRRHVFRNTVVGVLPIVGVQFIVTIGASALVENLLALPGLGRAVIDGASQGDTPVIQGVAITFAILVALTNLVIDIVQGVLNPKARI
jgi:peptide/nickel transport system permease protein